MQTLLSILRTIKCPRRWPLAVLSFGLAAALIAGCASGGYRYEGVDGPDPASALCASAGLPKFPWPMPPEPTSHMRVNRHYFDDVAGEAPTDLAAFLEHVRARMLAAKYPLPSVLGVGCNGFALVLPMERLRPDGRRFEGQDGFAGPGQRASFDFWSLIQQLMEARPGFYRVIVLVVASERLLAFSEPGQREDLMRLQRIGSDELPDPLARRPFGRGYEIHALVYEFENARDREGMTVTEKIPPEGRLPAITHLRQSGLVR